MPTKSIFASKTFWGSVISLVAMFAPKLFPILGFTVDASGQASLAAHIVSIIGFAVTVYGRFKATQPVSLLGGPAVSSGPSTLAK